MSIEAIKMTEINNTNFRAASNHDIATTTAPYPNDSVELSTKKEKKKTPTWKKFLKGLGITVVTITAASILYVKHKNSKLTKLYKEKLVISNLPEKLEFKEAKTAEEGIKYAKEVLGIKKVDENFTLDAINYANKGLVDVSNANKGKLFLPPEMKYIDTSEDFAAKVHMTVEDKDFGFLFINKNSFDKTKFKFYPEGHVIYHELGHLQDFAINLKKLDLKALESLKLKQIYKDIKEELKTGIKKEDRSGVDEVNNRWGSTYHERYAKLFKDNPDAFKKAYPDFYEFLTNQTIQQTAGKISEYSKTGIGEFIAETYANMIAGKKLPKDVIELYKKYNGPIPEVYLKML